MGTSEGADHASHIRRNTFKAEKVFQLNSCSQMSLSAKVGGLRMAEKSAFFMEWIGEHGRLGKVMDSLQ